MNRKSIATILCGVSCFYSISQADMMPGPGIVGTVEGGGISVVQVYADDGDGVFNPADVVVQTKSTNADGTFEFQNLDMNEAYFVGHDGDVSPLQHIGRIKSYIDSFDITQSVTSNPNSGFRLDSTSGPAEHMLGGFRDFYIDVLSGPAEGKLRSNPFSQTSNLQIDMSAGVTGMVAVTWDGVDGTTGMHPDAGLNVDLTNGGMYHGISLGLAVDRAGAGQILQLLMHSADGLSTAELELPVTPDVEPEQLTFLSFSDFIGDADPTDITAFQLMMETMPSLDAQISAIGLTGANEVNFRVVPEPSTSMLLLIGLMGLFGWRRRSR